MIEQEVDDIEKVNTSEKFSDVSVPDDGRQWYIIQCFSAQEYKVKARIEKLIEDKGYSDRVFRVLVPE